MSTAAQRTRRRASPARRHQSITAYLMLTPFAIVFATMLVAPLVFSGYLSLFRTQLVGGTVFVGLENYAKALVDPSFLGGLGRVALFLVIQVPIMLLLALLFALALDSGLSRASRFVRLSIFVPYAIPGVVATLMWGYMYSDAIGPISQVLALLGLDSPAFFSNAGIIPSIMNIVVWEWTGYNMIILYAALRSVPDELYEAAEVDGAGPFRKAWSIKIPAIRPALILTGIFAIIGTFQLFNEPKLLYELAPNVIRTDFSPNLYAYNEAFISRNVEYAAALAFLLGIAIMVLSYVFQLGTRRRNEPR
ncbi:MAG: carbohydrate ABC transporter permease [Beutenbergiaceae bacterium]